MTATRLAVRLHDAAAGLAIGIGLLKIEPQATETDRLRQTDQALAMLVEVQADLKRLSASFLDIAPESNVPSDLQLGLNREAKRLGVKVEIVIDGELSWLPANHAELVWLASREGLRNVRRHSGASACRIQVHLRSCPFVLRIRDWGGGVGPSAAMGEGIGLLGDMAARMGCEFRIGSQPGMGTELLVLGPPCGDKRERGPMLGSALGDMNPEIHELRHGN